MFMNVKVMKSFFIFFLFFFVFNLGFGADGDNSDQPDTTTLKDGISLTNEQLKGKDGFNNELKVGTRIKISNPETGSAVYEILEEEGGRIKVKTVCIFDGGKCISNINKGTFYLNDGTRAETISECGDNVGGSKKTFCELQRSVIISWLNKNDNMECTENDINCQTDKAQRQATSGKIVTTTEGNDFANFLDLFQDDGTAQNLFDFFDLGTNNLKDEDGNYKNSFFEFLGEDSASFVCKTFLGGDDGNKEQNGTTYRDGKAILVLKATRTQKVQNNISHITYDAFVKGFFINSKGNIGDSDKYVKRYRFSIEDGDGNILVKDKKVKVINGTIGKRHLNVLNLDLKDKDPSELFFKIEYRDLLNGKEIKLSDKKVPIRLVLVGDGKFSEEDGDSRGVERDSDGTQIHDF